MAPTTTDATRAGEHRRAPGTDEDAAGSTTGPLPDRLTPAEEASAGDTETSTPAPRRAQERTLTPLDPIRVLGQFLVWTGGTLVLFALFQLWGTGLLEWRAQQALDAEFTTIMAEARAAREQAATNPVADAESGDQTTAPVPDVGVTRPDPAEPAATAEEPAAPAPTDDGALPIPIVSGLGPDGLPVEGAPIGRITVPSIGMTKTVVQGVQRGTLRDGPGHYPTTPMPGQPGNASIAGHRTTHGAPFFDLDQIQPGDHIDVETIDGVFRYEVQGHTGPDGIERGHFVVDPSDVSVIGDHGDDRLTLTACHPKYSARQRIVVSALLVGEPTDSPVILAEPTAIEAPIDPNDDPVLGVETEAGSGDEAATTPAAGLDEQDGAEVDPGQTIGADPDLLEESLGWQTDQTEPTLLWATVTIVLLHAAWILGRLWRRLPAYVLSAPFIVVPLFICFIHLDRLLPAF